MAGLAILTVGQTIWVTRNDRRIKKRLAEALGVTAEEEAAGKRKTEASDWARLEIAAALKDLLATEVSTFSTRLEQLCPREEGGICGQ